MNEWYLLCWRKSKNIIFLLESISFTNIYGISKVNRRHLPPFKKSPVCILNLVLRICQRNVEKVCKKNVRKQFCVFEGKIQFCRRICIVWPWKISYIFCDSFHFEYWRIVAPLWMCVLWPALWIFLYNYVHLWFMVGCSVSQSIDVVIKDNNRWIFHASAVGNLCIWRIIKNVITFLEGEKEKGFNSFSWFRKCR